MGGGEREVGDILSAGMEQPVTINVIPTTVEEVIKKVRLEPSELHRCNGGSSGDASILRERERDSCVYSSADLVVSVIDVGTGGGGGGHHFTFCQNFSLKSLRLHN